ncbi:MAG TPA: DUF4058 family protein [Pirellulaceae bacterium]|nr:DUF4058 family protein [Pirellulaceae bacterium]
MPIHDWTRVSPGDFHDLHQVWTGQIRTALNDGILPSGYFAQVEQRASGVTPDVITLEMEVPDDLPDQGSGGVAVAEAPPRVRFHGELDKRLYAEMKNRVLIRHASDNRIIAIIELVSAGNKSNEREIQRFVEKCVSAIDDGIHLLIIDLYPPTARDPYGIHGAIWSELGDTPPIPPPEKNLTLASYMAARIPQYFVEPVSVGDVMIDMPLFYAVGHYVSVPLESTYMAAYRGVPAPIRAIVEAQPT